MTVIGEEVLFRGTGYEEMKVSFGVVPAKIIDAIAFSAVHIPQQVVANIDWEGAGFILQTMRSNGFQVPFADAVIAFIAMKYDIPLWTRDTHFLLIQGYYPELKLYEPI